MSKVTTAFILGASAIFSGILNYATYPILIHHLSIADYAEFSTWISLMAILSIPTAGFGYYMLVLFRQSFVEIQSHETLYIKKLWQYTLGYILIVVIVACIAFFWLKLTSYGALILIVLSLLPGLFAAFFAGLFQALEFFVFLAAMGVLSSVLRFGLSFGILIEPTVWMAMIPFLIPGCILTIIYIIRGKKELHKSHAHLIHKDNEVGQTHSIWNYVIITGVIILLQNIDVLMVRALFPDYDVTLYASVAVIAKFALIFIGILETIFSPSLVDLHKKFHHREYILLLGGFSLLGYVVAATFLPWAGNIVLHILKGELTGSWLLWTSLGVSMVSLGFFSIFAKVYLSWGGKIVTTITGVSLIFVLGFFAPTVEIFALIFALCLILLYGITLYKIYQYE